jgi:hypothetical protein
MSRDLYVLLLDLDKLKGVQGSGDRRLLKRILREKEAELLGYDECFRKDPALAPYAPLATAIEQIIIGPLQRQRTLHFQFEAAAAMIADILGKPLASEPLMEARERFWVEVDTVIRKKRTTAGLPKSGWPMLAEILKRGPLLKVPLDRRMRLGTGYLTAEEVRNAFAATGRSNLEDTQGLDKLTWPDLAMEAVRQYQNWLRQAAAKKLGLFFHC